MGFAGWKCFLSVCAICHASPAGFRSASCFRCVYHGVCSQRHVWQQWAAGKLSHARLKRCVGAAALQDMRARQREHDRILAADLLLSWLCCKIKCGVHHALREMRARQRSMSATSSWACVNAGMHASVLPGLLLEGVTRLEIEQTCLARSAQMRSASAGARLLPDSLQVCRECMVGGLATLLGPAHASQDKG